MHPRFSYENRGVRRRLRTSRTKIVRFVRSVRGFCTEIGRGWEWSVQTVRNTAGNAQAGTMAQGDVNGFVGGLEVRNCREVKGVWFERGRFMRRCRMTGVSPKRTWCGFPNYSIPRQNIELKNQIPRVECTPCHISRILRLSFLGHPGNPILGLIEQSSLAGNSV